MPAAKTLRRARAATVLLFFLTGAVFATWAARIPTIQERLDLSPGELSLVLVGLEAGALLGLRAGGRAISRVGSAAALRTGFAVFPVALVAAALAPSLAALAGAQAAMGVSNSVIDVAINAQGIELERRARRPLLSGLHSGHSFGVLAGGLAGTLLSARGVPVAVHFAVVAALAIAGAQRATTALVDERPVDAAPAGRRVDTTPATRPVDAAPAARPVDATPPERARARTTAAPRLAAIGALAFCAFFVEGAANDWSAVDARSAHGAGPALAAAAFTAFSLTLAFGRLGGDRLVARYGRGRSIRFAALVATAGAAFVVAAPSAWAALAAWALLGAGVAPIAPTLLGAAPGATSAPPAVAVARVSTIGYAGSFVGPPVIGGLAELTSLSTALACLVPAAVAIAALAPRALGRTGCAPGRDCAHIAAVLRSSQRTTCPEGGERPANQPFLHLAASASTRLK
jgi:MFS family permease